MSELLDKYNEIKRSRSENLDVLEIRKKIESLNQLDNESIMQAVGSAMVKFFADTYAKADERQEKSVKDITEVLGKMIVNSAKINKQNIIDVSNNLVVSVENAVDSINKTISNIPETDLSEIDEAIKNIKPTDLSELRSDINVLTNSINKLIEIEFKNSEEKEEIDLTPIIEELSKPVNVNFSIEYDQWDYPVKVTAIEVK